MVTVLRGAAAVRKSDGTPLSPAPSGLTIGVGDQVSTLEVDIEIPLDAAKKKPVNSGKKAA